MPPGDISYPCAKFSAILHWQKNQNLKFVQNRERIMSSVSLLFNTSIAIWFIHNLYHMQLYLVQNYHYLFLSQYEYDQKFKIYTYVR